MKLDHCLVKTILSKASSSHQTETYVFASSHLYSSYQLEEKMILTSVKDSWAPVENSHYTPV